MKRIMAVLCACLLMLSVTACGNNDLAAGKAALEAGDYTEAYARLSASSKEEAAALLKKLVFVPVKQTEGSMTNTYRYDEKGNLTRVDNDYGDFGGAVTKYTYNEKNQLVLIDSVNGAKVKTTTAYTYDEAGNRVLQEWVCDGVTTKHEYTFDAQNRCTRKVQTYDDGSVHTTEMRYDDNGNMTYEKIAYSDGTWQERSMTYTADNKLLGESGIDSGGGGYDNAYTYDNTGLLLKQTVAGEDFTFTYDEKGNLTQETNCFSGTVSTYTYDKMGNRLSEKHVTTDGKEYTTDNTYDEEGRLLSTQNNNGDVRRFTYDAYGNKLTESCTSGAASYSWEYEWELHYYPDGVPQEVEEVRLSKVNVQAVM